MNVLKKITFTVTTLGFMLLFLYNQVFASIITQDEVQATVDSVGKEQVTGNILIWFLCAIAFLKISQKIDSYLATLGVNVGHTGGSMLGDAMVVMKGLSVVKSGGNLLGGKFGGGSGNSSPSSGGGFLSGGLAGAIGRQINNSAAASATGLGGNPITGKMFDSSLSSGGKFANDIIGKIAKGDISKTGSITGDKAASALMSYLGGTSPASGLAETPDSSIGQALSGTDSSSTDLPETQGSVDSQEIGEAPFDDSTGSAIPISDELTSPEIDSTALSVGDTPEIGSMALAEDSSEEGHLHIPPNSAVDENPINNADYSTSAVAYGGIEPSTSIPISATTSEQSSLPEKTTELLGFEAVSGSTVGSDSIGTTPFTEHKERAPSSTGFEESGSTETSSSPASVDTPTTPISYSSIGEGATIGSAPFTESNTPATSIDSGAIESSSSANISSGEVSQASEVDSSVSVGDAPFTPHIGSGVSGGDASFASEAGGNVTIDAIPQTSGSSLSSSSASDKAGYSAGSSQPIFSDVEIGGGRIIGTEKTTDNPGGIKFGMYDTAQYAEPSGNYSIVNTIDGSKWYKQYAVDTVRKMPYKNEDGKIKYKEEIVKALPPVPKRKDRI